MNVGAISLMDIYDDHDDDGGYGASDCGDDVMISEHQVGFDMMSMCFPHSWPVIVNIQCRIASS